MTQVSFKQEHLSLHSLPQQTHLTTIALAPNSAEAISNLHLSLPHLLLGPLPHFVRLGGFLTYPRGSVEKDGDQDSHNSLAVLLGTAK